MQKREWRLLAMLPLLLFILGAIIQGAMKYAESIPVGSVEPEIPEVPLAAMPALRLADAPALPSQAEIAHEIPFVRDLVKSRANIRHDEVIDAPTLAWAGILLAGDQAAPPIPQRVQARDLLTNGARPGSAILLSGRLADSVAAPVAGGEPWQRLAVALDDHQYAQVLAPAEAARLVIGREVSVVGRFLGLAQVPVETDQPGAAAAVLAVPLVAARLVHEAGPANPAEDAGNDYRRMFPGLPDDLYADLSDERSVLETRAYYHLLGQVANDQVINPGPAANGNLNANALHQDPAPYRGKRYTVTGHVIRAWEDDGVARDRPFGVRRVVRALLWNRDFGQITEIENGTPVFKSQILRLYEVAAITDQPLPAKGEVLNVEGRFFKFRAIPVPPDPQRDRRNGVQRQSDRVYPFVFVTAGWQVVPPPPRYEFGWGAWAFSAAILGLAAILTLLVRRDARFQAQVHGQVQALRRTRRALERKRSQAGAPAEAPNPSPAAGVGHTPAP